VSDTTESVHKHLDQTTVLHSAYRYFEIVARPENSETIDLEEMSSLRYLP